MQTDQGLKKGRLIVIDGIDGSGKTTQVDLLSEYLKNKNISFEVISFPRYEDNLYGKLIRRYLSGEFGSIQEVNPYLMALSYAGDRALAKPLIENWLSSGKLVVANRYVSSSKAHLGANLPQNQREEFMSWVDELEYQTNSIPKMDLTILLNVDPKIGQENVKGEKDPLDLSNKRDIHEDNLEHLSAASRIFLKLSQSEANWKVIDCGENLKMKSKDEIHKEIIHYLQNVFNRVI